ncbi:valine--tRNA ligase, mitochondrial [Ahaetulla prasina]|uniref:valine--tRNA ligase, mitochondrial n=1 Tax=Ahaetulla prasina TaxID=499056 RepID=UPI00264997B6|nr:valine--tRNA ligase, mitochondrial [Ahaetulla prasina]
MPSAHLNSASHWNMSLLCRLLLWAEKKHWGGFGGWGRSYSQGSKPDLNKQVGKMDHLKNKEQRQKRLWKKMEAIEAQMAAGPKESHLHSNMRSAHLNSAFNWNMSLLCRLLLWAEKKHWDGFGGWRRSYSQGSKPDLNKQVGKMDHLKNKEQRQKRLWKKMEAIEAQMAAGPKEPSNQNKTLSSRNITEYDIPTIAGQKKDTSAPLPASYSPRYVEAAWYPWWVKEGFFKPECQQHLPHRKPETFSISLPPPNVTGSLHLGHALTVAIEDALVRWRRMQGYRVLWLPGSDHAGIATQAVVEKKIWKERGVLRQDLSRDEFLQEVWKWIEEKGNEIFKQLKEMGASLDWDRACFTMDSSFSQAVTEAFVQLHEQGLIYRDRRLVNWSCALQSAISDIEVENRQIKGRTKLSVPGLEDKVLFGILETFAYKVEGEEGMELPVSTTRPETMFGDVAVAIHPDDSRYLHLHGKSVCHPFTGRLLPIITDPAVELQMGTGAVKVTPAHNHVDYKLAQRHNLPLISVIAENGTMTAECGEWVQGLHRFLAREKVLAALKEKGLYRGAKDHCLVLPICSRSGDVIEIVLKNQWFVRSEAIAQSALEAVESGSLKLIPQFYEKSWRTWLLSINDWCISRQLWWGHQIPAYRVMLPGSPGLEERKENDGLWVVGRTEAEARTKAAGMLGKAEEQLELVRDSDVLDTWFSSSLFPFAALGWPHKVEDLQQFFPNNLLETGSDLLFFWVARMVMLGKQLTGELPFSQVFLHSLIHDAHGRKMSKSLGNVIDPLDVIHGASLQVLQQKLKDSTVSPRELVIGSEGLLQNFPQGIAESGSDALRFALCRYDAHGTSINLDMADMEKASHFCNKVWNALKFTFAALGEEFAPLDPEQHSITNVLPLSSKESVKPILRSGDPVRLLSTRQTLYSCVDLALRLLSPFMPFVTEELWQRLPKTDLETSPSICVARYPSPERLRHWCNPEEEANFLLVQQIIQVIRSMRATYQLTKARPTVYLACSETAPWAAYEKYQEPLQTLSFSGSVNLLPNSEEMELPLNCLAVKANGHTSVYMDLQDLVDPHKELLKLTSRQQKLKQQLANLTEKLQKQNSLKAKMNHEQKISLLRSELQHIEQAFATFQKMAK